MNIANIKNIKKYYYYGIFIGNLALDRNDDDNDDCLWWQRTEGKFDIC